LSYAIKIEIPVPVMSYSESWHTVNSKPILACSRWLMFLLWSQMCDIFRPRERKEIKNGKVVEIEAEIHARG